MGCPGLVVVTNHKLLVSILGDKELGDVTNMRLFCLKQQMALWQFDIAHMPGKRNGAADAASWFPMGLPPLPDEEDVAGVEAVAFFAQEAQRLTLSWEDIQVEAAADESYSELLRTIRAGFPDTARLVVATAPYWLCHHGLWELENDT